MTETEVLKYKVVVNCVGNAIESISKYCENPPLEVEQAINFITMAHYFLMSAATKISGNQEEIDNLPERIKGMWDIDLTSLGIPTDEPDNEPDID